MLISVIVTSYNSSKTIVDTLDSLLEQSNIHGFECIIIDGQSVDGTLEIINRYLRLFEEKGIETKLLSESDRGIYDAWNKGLNLASGQYIAFLNSDDWYHREVIAEVLSSIKKRPDSLIVAGVLEMISTEGKRVETRKHNCVHLKSMYEMPLLFPALFVHMSLYEISGGFDDSFRLSGDYDFVMRTYDFWKEKIIYSENTRVYMRRGGITSSVKHMSVGLKEDFKVLIRERPFSAIFAILRKVLIKLLVVLRK